MNIRRKRKKKKQKQDEISLDEILLDSSNLPSFNVHSMEGRMELPLSRKSIYAVGFVFFLIAGLFFTQLYKLQVTEGAVFKDRSENNRLHQTAIVAERGLIYDRTGEPLAWNELDKSGKYNFPIRAYTNRKGLGPLLGYVSYPQKDSSGFYYRAEYIGRNGIEKAFNNMLQGQNGQKLVETNAHGGVVSGHIVNDAVPGKDLTLSIDAQLSEAMRNIIATNTVENGFRSGGGAIMDIHTGEMLALANYPAYDPQVLADGKDSAAINKLNNEKGYPFLNKVTGGVYTPGSIVKPFMAYAALVEHIIDPNKIIYSNGELIVPNPYNPSNPSIFRDWRAQGAMTMWDAIAYSSDVYFYIIGGGFEDQEGLGINRIDKYMNMFGFGQKIGITFGTEQAGTVPSPEWKQNVFNDEWRLGDTYHTAIGQFGFQVTPLQMLRAYAAIANGGTLVTPQIVLGAQGSTTDLALDQNALQVVREGMRQTITSPRGTALALRRDDVKIAAKSGTAELGSDKAHVNTWIMGYFPYEHPKYAFVLFMEYGPRSNTVGASTVMGHVFDWIAANEPQYIQSDGGVATSTDSNK
jgi:penicillin-binding protein 2